MNRLHRHIFLCFVTVVLAACGGSGGGDNTQLATPVDSTKPTTPTINEMRAKPVRIVLIVSAAQMQANEGKIRTFADVLASDLNRRAFTRSGENAATYSVELQYAASTAQLVRDQLKSYDSAMLIGIVPVPLTLDGTDQLTKPLLDPFRLPACNAYSFDVDGNHLKPFPQVINSDPSCRYGMPVAVLRGRNQSLDVTDVEAKLDQFIEYHRNSDQQNMNWSPVFQYVDAIWLGGASHVTQDILSRAWSAATLNGFLNNYPSPRAVAEGTAIERKNALSNCLSSIGEICLFNGHGLSTNILFEGPSTPDKFYSDDYTFMYAGELPPMGIRAKFVDLTSCSSQNFLADGSFANTLLMTGKTMLTAGTTTAAWSSSNIAITKAQEIYPALGLGSTFAEAVRGSMEGNALAFQGDPFISFRPVPKTAPKLLINGKHYNDGNFTLPMTFQDSVSGSASQVVLALSNAGAVDLHIQLSWASMAWSIDGHNIPDGGYNGGFTVREPSPIDGGEAYGSAIGNRIFTVKPNQTMNVTYQMAPWVSPPATEPMVGTMGSTLEIFSDDPASFRVTVDATMTVR